MSAASHRACWSLWQVSPATASHNRLGLLGSLVWPDMRLGLYRYRQSFPDFLLAGVLAAVGQTPRALRLPPEAASRPWPLWCILQISVRGICGFSIYSQASPLRSFLRRSLRLSTTRPSFTTHSGVFMIVARAAPLPLGVAFLDFPAKHRPVCAERFYRLDLGRLEQSRQHGGTHGRQGVVLVGIALWRRTAANAHRHYVPEASPAPPRACP